MNILVLGGAGYVGRVLLNRLASGAHSLSIVDLFYFSSPDEVENLANIKVKNTREVVQDDFEGIDAVLDLAAISNDPAGELAPELTRQVNAEARIRCARLARAAGVGRYLLLSSCSVYGANDHVVDETSPLNPLTVYARSNAAAETGVLALNDDGFCATVFRLATVFGASPSMRFDLVVNTMTLRAFETGTLQITGGGEQYRPLVHVEDVGRAVEAVLRAPAAVVADQIFNISAVNLKMREVAAAVAAGIARETSVEIDASNIDHRNYRVATDKAEAALDFRARHSVEDGAARIMAALADGSLRNGPLTIRLNGYRRLVERMAS